MPSPFEAKEKTPDYIQKLSQNTCQYKANVTTLL